MPSVVGILSASGEASWVEKISTESGKEGWERGGGAEEEGKSIWERLHLMSYTLLYYLIEVAILK